MQLRLPAPLPRRHTIPEEALNLLHTSARNFANAEPHICEGNEAQSGVHEAGLRTQVCRVVEVGQRD
jgi:hypothetical protein